MTDKLNALHPFTPRRSVLFVPAINQKALQKAATLAADCLIFDLEDSVAPTQKGEARENLRTLFRQEPFPRHGTIIRINDLATPFGSEDLMAALSCRPNAILLPKTSTPQQVIEIADAMEASDAPEVLRLWAMIETPLGILNIADIAALASNPQSRLDCLVLGPNDLARETGTVPGEGRQNHLPWLMQVIAAGRAYGLDVLDGVFNDFRDSAGFEQECRQARDLGFSGKTLIHPTQIGPSNTIFSPGEEEIARARLIIEAFSRKENHNQGVIQIDGLMVERLHLQMAIDLIAQHKHTKRGN
jgi:citrate lyase subunit beta/citryl-CoA lyase